MSKEKCSIVFTGDIGFDRYMAGRWNDDNLLSKPILDFLHEGDHVVANVEGALIDAKDDGSRGVFFHSMNPDVATLLKRIHADIWNIGNNHTMDAGKAGLVSTRNIAHSMGCCTIGAGLNETEASEPVYLDEAGGIGIFGVSYLNECVPATETEPGIFRWNNMEYIARRIAEIKRKCHWCIMVAHGGEEFADIPNPYTRDRYLKFLEFGADVVVAHHPHVPENYELFGHDKAIFYSLGNFIFDTDYQRVHPYTDVGILLKLVLTRDKLNFEAIGNQIIRGEERIDICPLPDIFENIPADEYELLKSLGAKAFISEEMKKMIYLEPNRFKNVGKKMWDSYFFSTEPDGYFKGQHMDLSLIIPLSEKFYDGLWKTSRLGKVKNYILKHIQ